MFNERVDDQPARTLYSLLLEHEYGAAVDHLRQNSLHRYAAKSMVYDFVARESSGSGR